MDRGKRRKIGERSQVTIPKEFRERFGMEGGDHVVFHEKGGKLVIERPVTREELAEGYRKRSQRTRELDEELEGVSTEANAQLGDTPEW